MGRGGGVISVPDLPPPVGAWQHYDFDPRARWPWTAWERHAEGTYLVSAGSTYQPGKGYGATRTRSPRPRCRATDTRRASLTR